MCSGYIDHCRLPGGSAVDLLAHNVTIYNGIESLSGHVYKLCNCLDSNGTVCTYNHYKKCTTITRGKLLKCTIQTNIRRKRDLRKHQETAQLMNDHHIRSQVTLYTLHTRSLLVRRTVCPFYYRV
jgi:hypothetical protein